MTGTVALVVGRSSSSSDEGVYSFDVSDPTLPRYNRKTNLAASGRNGIAIHDDAIYTVDNGTLSVELGILGDDTVHPSGLVGRIDLSGDSYALAAHAQFLFAVSNLSVGGSSQIQLRVFDVAELASPILVGALHLSRITLTTRLALRVDGSTAFITHPNGLETIDIKNPSQPVLLNGESFAFSPVDSWLEGNFLYLLAYEASVTPSVEIFDVSIPEAKEHVRSVPLSSVADRVRKIRVHQDFAYVAGSQTMNPGSPPAGLIVLDVSDPASAHIVASVDLPKPAELLAILNDTAWVGSGPQNTVLHIAAVNIEDPRAPQLVTIIGVPVDTVSLVGMGGFLYAGSSPTGAIIDAHEPLTARCVGTINAEGRFGRANGIEAKDGHIWSIDNNVSSRGIDVYLPQCEIATSSLPSATFFRRMDVFAQPNPSNPSVQIRFALPTAGPANVSVFDIRGRRVATLLRGWTPAGPHSVNWIGEDVSGRSVSSGVYLVTVRSKDAEGSARVTLVK